MVADDDATTRALLCAVLVELGHDTFEAEDGAMAWTQFQAERPALAVLDIEMPELDGLEVCRRIRNGDPQRETFILVCTGRDHLNDLAAVLDAGADDYVVKPFGMDELLARLRAAIRRGSATPAQPTIATDTFTIDLGAGRVTAADGSDIRLTPTEWHLLEVLARHPGRVVDHGRLLTEVWGPAYRDQTNYLRVYMATLRRKLEADAAQPRHLLTEAGRGYRFEP
jgi:two-component system KDP operon response regulator KdpE